MKKLLTQNSKLKKTSKITGIKTFDFALPAIKTCPFSGDCKKFCYAKKGAYIWPAAKNKHQWNFEQTKEKSFITDILKEIDSKKIKAVRIHSSGDFYNKTYVKKWLKIIESRPDVTFYAYTKSIRLFKDIKLPKNFTLIFSYGGLDDSLIKKTDRHAKVFEAGQMPKNYAYANDNDHIALARNKRIGLIKH